MEQSGEEDGEATEAAGEAAAGLPAARKAAVATEVAAATAETTQQWQIGPALEGTDTPAGERRWSGGRRLVTLLSRICGVSRSDSGTGHGAPHGVLCVARLAIGETPGKCSRSSHSSKRCIRRRRGLGFRV